MPSDSFDARADLEVGGRSYEIYRLDALQSSFDVARLPFSLKILLENLLRNEDGDAVTARGRRGAGALGPLRRADRARSPFTPARVVLQDFTGVPAWSTSPRCATPWPTWAATPGRSTRSCPPSWSSTTRSRSTRFGTRDAFRVNAEKEFERNHERYAFLRWGQSAFDGFKVVPPDTGIVHQVNLEYLARVVLRERRACSTPTRWSGPTRTPR